ncbi:hypothetical protein L484_013937 [Morus notabilis]|uniref:VQ domain-containing protein n=1 Tax=Morus notabilis TaxID=981085 RepID=W9R567_9ROSA|nr:sigma factor binding protein 1, chloroplastic [Morus notabilis]EXB38304.1 hypothetical protein L484_013937 [Morus notabilis]
MASNSNVLTSLQRKPTKKTSANNKTKKTRPVKVVYISNPMKIKTSASEFRALVQELTGQDAEFPDPTKFLATNGEDQVGVDSTVKIGGDHSNSQEQGATESNNSSTTTTSRYEALDDDVFMPQMMESFEAGIFPSSATASVWYDSANYHQVHDVIRSLDAM